MILTMRQIKELAEFTGFVVADHFRDDELAETRIEVVDCPPAGIGVDEEEGGGVAHYEFVAFFHEYPAEGCIGLGPEVPAPVAGPVQVPDGEAIAWGCEGSTGVHFASVDRDECVDESRSDGSRVVPLCKRTRPAPDSVDAAERLLAAIRNTPADRMMDVDLSLAETLLAAARPDDVVQMPSAKEVARIGDMNPLAALRVGLDGDSDVYLSTTNGVGEGVEFCTGGSGGGKSPKTREALIALMVAMESDNQADPRRDWWKRRMGKAHAAAQQGEEGK